MCAAYPLVKFLFTLLFSQHFSVASQTALTLPIDFDLEKLLGMDISCFQSSLFRYILWQSFYLLHVIIMCSVLGVSYNYLHADYALIWNTFMFQFISNRKVNAYVRVTMFVPNLSCFTIRWSLYGYKWWASANDGRPWWKQHEQLVTAKKTLLSWKSWGTV